MRLNSAISAAAFRAVAKTFGEVVRIEPLIEGEHQDGFADPDRATVEAIATCSFTPVVDSFDGVRTGGGKIATTTRVAQREVSIWFTPAAYADIGYPLSTGDRIRFPSRPKEPSYTLSRAPVFSDRGDVSVFLVMERS